MIFKSLDAKYSETGGIRSWALNLFATRLWEESKRMNEERRWMERREKSREAGQD